MGYIPNSFQTPNKVVDELMSLLSGNELKVYLFTIRHIYGWQNRIDDNLAHISQSMYLDGFASFDGVGITKPTLKKALKALIRYKLIIPVTHPDNNRLGQAYSISLNPDISGLKIRAGKAEQDKTERGAKDLPPEGGKIFTQRGAKDLPPEGQNIYPNKTQDKTQDKSQPEADSPPLEIKRNKRNELFDWLAEHVFKQTSGLSISKQTGARIGKALKAIKGVHTGNGTELSLAHLEAFKEWYSDNYDGIDIPRTDFKLAEFYSEFYGWAKSRQDGVKKMQALPAFDSGDYLETLGGNDDDFR